MISYWQTTRTCERLHIIDKCVIVFDSYSKEVYNIKMTKRTRRYAKIVTPNVNFNEEMNASITQKFYYLILKHLNTSNPHI